MYKYLTLLFLPLSLYAQEKHPLRAGCTLAGGALLGTLVYQAETSSISKGRFQEWGVMLGLMGTALAAKDLGYEKGGTLAKKIPLVFLTAQLVANESFQDTLAKLPVNLSLSYMDNKNTGHIRRAIQAFFIYEVLSALVDSCYVKKTWGSFKKWITDELWQECTVENPESPQED